MDALYLLQKMLPANKCTGLNDAVLTFSGHKDKELQKQLELCSNEIGSNNADPTINVQSYFTLNIPSIYSSNSTFLTGIRGVNASSEVYISGFSKATDQITIGYVYKGDLSGNGQWYPFNYPEDEVTSTSVYGPNNGNVPGAVQAVGSYTLNSTGGQNYGFLYQGPLDASGSWTRLNPQSLSQTNISDTIAHSTMGGLVVGNYDLEGSEEQGRAFVYDINHGTYGDLSYPGAISMTAYGIWYNGDTSYTIAGGASTPLLHSYLVDYDSSTNTTSNWRFYEHDNNLLPHIDAHFEGITKNGDSYNLCAGWLSVADKTAHASFVHLDANENAVWVDFKYPNSTLTTPNTVYENNLLGIYFDEESITHGYVASFG